VRSREVSEINNYEHSSTYHTLPSAAPQLSCNRWKQTANEATD